MWFVIRVPVAIQDTSACTFASRGVTGVAPCTSNIVGIPPPSLGYLSLCHALLLERELAPEQLLVQHDGGSVLAACQVHVGRGQGVVKIVGL